MIFTAIADGLPGDNQSCELILQPCADEAVEPRADSLLWRGSLGAPGKLSPLKFIAIGLARADQSLFALGRLGQVARVDDSGMALETIQGPEDYGFLTCFRRIGKHLYAAGMWRQVFVRTGLNQWTRADDGVLSDLASASDVTGFQAIDGLTENDIYAVGLDGEIWNRRRETWHRIDSPTNLTLEQVRAVAPDLVYAVGQHGTILRGARNRWSVIEQTETEEDFWGLEWFNEALYVCTSSQIFRLSGEGELTELELPGEPTTSLTRLRAGGGALWLFGGNRAFWTEDGEDWREADFYPWPGVEADR